MPELILTAEQAGAIAGALGPVIVRDPNGQVVGHMEPKLTPEVIAELKRRAASPGLGTPVARSKRAYRRCKKNGTAQAGLTKSTCMSSWRVWTKQTPVTFDRRNRPNELLR
jgi:hypothetical protein